MRALRLAMAQINCTVGDLEGNRIKIIDYIARAKDAGADVVAFPELAITGYPPEDLLLKPRFIDDNLRALDDIIAASKDITTIVGFVDRADDIYNAAAIISDGTLVDIYRKMHLPNYGVFDEYRYFQAGRDFALYSLNGCKIGINICEDIWYPDGPARAQALSGAELIININASPYYKGKWKFRRHMLTARAADNVAIIAYTNMVGGQDELVFDGQSMVFDEKGRQIAQGPQFTEGLVIADLDVESVFHARLIDPRNRRERNSVRDESVRLVKITGSPSGLNIPLEAPTLTQPMAPMEELLSALVVGTRDYTTKNGFKKALVSLSGGLDSSIVAAVAVEALGADYVVGTFFPFKYTSTDSADDARELAANLGIRLIEIPIEQVYDGFMGLLEPTFAGMKPDVTEENLQARIRGNMLMAISNKFGWLVLTTGNKSEMSTGYATLYGDMAGGFAVIKDVPKTMVFELSAHVNTRAGRVIIPTRVLTKEPSAELAPDQKDSDSLPPYAMLDPILRAYVEDDRGYEEMIRMGFPEDAVRRVIKLVDKSEYKRRQAPPGIKITPRALGKDRRFPITNRYRSS